MMEVTRMTESNIYYMHYICYIYYKQYITVM
jgi:hypothetical protein